MKMHTSSQPRVCSECEHYDSGLCTLVYKLAHEYRNMEEIEGGCGSRARFYVQWRDLSKRDWVEHPAKPEVWR